MGLVKNEIFFTNRTKRNEINPVNIIKKVEYISFVFFFAEIFEDEHFERKRTILGGYLRRIKEGEERPFNNEERI